MDARGSGEEEEEIVSLRCRFLSMLPELQVTRDPFSVPARLGRKGLTEVHRLMLPLCACSRVTPPRLYVDAPRVPHQIINHLLGGRGSAERSFDFLVFDSGAEVEREDASTTFARLATKRLLRGSLRSHIRELGMSSERLLTIEYTTSLPRPSKGEDSSMPDWVGSVAAVLGDDFVAGCYDGRLRLLDGHGGQDCDVHGHEGAVKAVASNGGVVASGGQDKTLRVWRVEARNLFQVREAGQAGFVPLLKSALDSELVTSVCLYTAHCCFSCAYLCLLLYVPYLFDARWRSARPAARPVLATKTRSKAWLWATMGP